MPKLTQAKLKELLHYNTDTGVFIRRVSTSSTARKGDIAGSYTQGYCNIRVVGVLYRAHRLAWLYMNGEWPEYEIDHINGDKGDNREANLRDVSHQENGKNQRMSKNNTSGVMGVSWDKSSSKWRAYIKVAGSRKNLGRFNCITAAAITRKAAEVKYGFHANHGVAA